MLEAHLKLLSDPGVLPFCFVKPPSESLPVIFGDLIRHETFAASKLNNGKGVNIILKG